MISAICVQWREGLNRDRVGFVPVRILLAALLSLLVVTPPALAGSRYVGYLGNGEGRAFMEPGQGARHVLAFTDSRSSSVRYRVCIRGGAGRINRCFRRRLRDGFGEVDVSLLVNDRGGPGRYRARWHVAGKSVAVWPFRLRPEGA